MHVYTARQAIFNRSQNVVAYELLYRNSMENMFPNIDPQEATSKMIMQTHLNQGIKPITGGKPALINFSERALLDGLPLVLPHDQVIIEILENVSPSDEVFEACRQLFHQGYRLALDDFVYEPGWLRFFNIIKLIKFDIVETPLANIGSLVEQIKLKKNIKLLAEKIETKEEFVEAKVMGFDYFQGYYFCQPEMGKTKDFDNNNPLLLNLLQESLRTPFDITRISACFEKDPGLSFKLLRFVNSGVLPIKQEIHSIKNAVVYIGEEQLRKLILLLTSDVMLTNKPKELSRVATMRARFCELIAKHYIPTHSDDAFIVGLFSLLDAMLDQPLENILISLPLAKEVTDALLTDAPSPLKYTLKTVIDFDKGFWHETVHNAEIVRCSIEELQCFYAEAIEWSTKI
ncbi:EAL and HDOD domain-containing protein [Thalassotalea fusca]